MLDIKNKKIQDIIDSINKYEEEKKEILKKCDGCIYYEILIPDMDLKKFEDWQIGNNTDGLGYELFASNSRGTTQVVFLNSLRAFLNRFEKEHPMAILGNHLSMLKNHMVIDEEDKSDES